MSPTMSEELEQLLKNLRLRRVLEIYDEQLRAADKEDRAFLQAHRIRKDLLAVLIDPILERLAFADDAGQY